METYEIVWTEYCHHWPELDGPEMLQFAMMFVQGALKKSQVCDIKHRFVVSYFVDTTFACLVVAKKCRHYD